MRVDQDHTITKSKYHSNTYVGEAAELGIFGQFPRTLEAVVEGKLLAFDFLREDRHAGELAGVYYKERAGYRQLLVIND